MMHSPKMQGVKQAEHVRLSKLIGARLRSLREDKKLTSEQLAAALGQTKRAVEAAEAGNNLTNYIKLAELARLLDTTPNEILGFEPSGRSEDREAFQGIIESSLISRGMAFEEAEQLARVVLEVLEAPEVRTAGASIRHNARLLALAVIRGFFEK